MPNWVWNQLTITGERHEMDVFIEKASASAIDWMTEDDRDSELSFANFIRPTDHEERMEYIGYCYCEENEDTDYMYEDCPKRKELADA